MVLRAETLLGLLLVSCITLPMVNAETATCALWGDPHIQTFDNLHIEFQGNCRYVLVSDCQGQDTFTIEVVFQGSESGRAKTGIKSFTIKYKSAVIDLCYNHALTINGNSVRSPATLSGVYDVSIYRNSIFVRLDNGVVLEWHDNIHAAVTIDDTFRTTTCGLCGYYDGDKTNDLRKANGNQLATGSVVREREFGDSWRTGVDPPGCKATTPSNGCRQVQHNDIDAADNEACEAIMDTMMGLLGTTCMPTDMEAEFRRNCLTEICDCHAADCDDHRQNPATHPCPVNHTCACRTAVAMVRHCKRQGKYICDSWRDDVNCPGHCIYGGNIIEDGSTWTDGVQNCVCNVTSVTCTNPDCDCPRCPPGWLNVGDRCFFGKSCRYVKCSANTARARCGYLGATLARVLHVDDAMYFMSNIFGFTGRYMFVDGRDEGAEGAWLNVDGTSVAPLTWHTNGGNTATRDCMYVMTDVAGDVYRYAIDCGEAERGKRWGFVCERPST